MLLNLWGGCGTGGSAVASNSRDPRFESIGSQVGKSIFVNM